MKGLVAQIASAIMAYVLLATGYGQSFGNLSRAVVVVAVCLIGPCYVIPRRNFMHNLAWACSVASHVLALILMWETGWAEEGDVHRMPLHSIHGFIHAQAVFRKRLGMLLLVISLKRAFRVTANSRANRPSPSEAAAVPPSSPPKTDAAAAEPERQ